MTVHVSVDFRELEQFLEDVQTKSRDMQAMYELVRIVEASTRAAITRGGYAGKGRGLTVLSNSGVQWTMGDSWEPTNPQWAERMNKGHQRPLYHTGRFQRSITSGIGRPGEAWVGNINTGGSTAGGSRFHFGDAFLGSWSWSAEVNEAGKLEDGTGHWRRFSPRIISRPIWILFESDVKRWWLKVSKRFGKTR